MMKKIILISFLMLSSCATKKTVETSGDEGAKAAVTHKVEKSAAEPTKAGIVVDAKDLAVLEDMNKAVEAYVLKKDTKSFAKLCKDKRFDCFVDNVYFPKKKKKIARAVPPYASGSKMGLHGETRVQVKYDFYP